VSKDTTSAPVVEDATAETATEQPQVTEQTTADPATADQAPASVDYATATDEALATVRSEAEAILTEHLGAGFSDLDEAAFNAAVDALGDNVEALAAVVTALDTFSGASGEIVSREAKAAAAKAEAIERAKSLRPAALRPAAAPIAASVAPSPRTTGNAAELARMLGVGSTDPAPAPALSVGGRRVKAPTTITMGTTFGAHVAGSKIASADVAATVSGLSKGLISAGHRQVVLSVAPDFERIEASRTDVPAGIACEPAEPDFAVYECGSMASQWELAFEVTNGNRPEQFRPAMSGSIAVNEWDGVSDKTCVSDDCEPFITPPSRTIYQCLTIKNEDEWGSPETVEAFIRRAERGWISSANGRAWEFVKANSTQWTNTNANNRPVSALFASHFGADLGIALDQLREDDVNGLTVLVDRLLLWGIATDGVLRDLGPGSVAQAEVDALRIISRLAPGARVVPMWDAPTTAGGPLYTGTAPTGGPGPELAGQSGSFAIFRTGDYRRRTLGQLELGFDPGNRFRGNDNVAENTAQWFQELKYQDQFRGCFSVWHTVDICVNGAWPGPYDAVSSCNVDGVQP
jgi:hypothetical protein